MRGLQEPIVGRDDELFAVGRFVDGIVDGPASLVLAGPAGIGKTATGPAVCWRPVRVASWFGRAAAPNPMRVGRSPGWAIFSRHCRARHWLSFQRCSDCTFGRAAAVRRRQPRTGRPNHRREVLGVLRILARSGPLLLAVDDIHWLDASSGKVLSFALRRLSDEPIRLLASCRTGPSTDTATTADLGLPGERIVVGPVSVGIMQRIIRNRLSQTLTRPTLTRLHQATGGNPMMCLEMARALQRRGQAPSVGEPLPVPADLRRWSPNDCAA